MASAQRLGTYGSRRGVAPTVFPPNSYLITKPIQKGIPVANTDTPRIPHGQNVYIYRNVQTDQIVYSLSRHLHVHIPSTRSVIRPNFNARIKTLLTNYHI